MDDARPLSPRSSGADANEYVIGVMRTMVERVVTGIQSGEYGVGHRRSHAGMVLGQLALFEIVSVVPSQRMFDCVDRRAAVRCRRPNLRRPHRQWPAPLGATRPADAERTGRNHRRHDPQTIDRSHGLRRVRRSRGTGPSLRCRHRRGPSTRRSHRPRSPSGVRPRPPYPRSFSAGPRHHPPDRTAAAADLLRGASHPTHAHEPSTCIRRRINADRRHGRRRNGTFSCVCRCGRRCIPSLAHQAHRPATPWP